MRDRDYGWRRFWCPRDGQFFLDGDYLSDPEHKLAKWMPSQVVASAVALEKACVVLLGEPGIGKSTEVRRLAADTGGEEPAVQEILVVDLNVIGSESSLATEVFEHDKVRHWRQNQSNLRIILDSFDECILRVETIVNRLAGWLQRAPTERLQLVVACRTMSWPTRLEEIMRSRWSPNEVGIFELLPLRRTDVEFACQAEGVDAEGFLKAVHDLDVGSFAAKPLTLRFLLKEYSRHGQLPGSQTELYRRSLREICQEWNPSRRETGRSGRLDPDRRLLIASRIAGVMQLCGRRTIWIGVRQYEKPEGAVSLAEIAGGAEGGVDVTENVLREVLDTGLFTARGASAMGWGHQSYAEFLAAFWLAQRQVPSEQALTLLTGPEKPLLVPQLASTAAWLASMEPQQFHALVENNPGALLDGDIRALTAHQRELVVAQILLLVERGEIEDPWRILRTRPGRLAHPNLASQLEPYVRNREKPTHLRQIALGIAEAGQVEPLQGTLLKIALDLTDDPHVRGAAVRALATVGSFDNRLQLKILLGDDASVHDPEDEIRGGIFSALWPDGFTPEELFSSFTLPKRENLIGSYHAFLAWELPKRLTPKLLPQSLQWIEEEAKTHRESTPIDRGMGNILRASLNYLELEPVRRGFARAAVARRLAGKSIFDETTLSDKHLPEEERRGAVLAILDSIEDPTTLERTLTGVRAQSLILDTDFNWLIERLDRVVAPAERRGVIRILRGLWSASRPSSERTDAILELAKTDPCVTEEFEYWLTPVELTSDKAAKYRESFGHSTINDTDEAQEDAEDYVAEVRTLLDRFGQGDLKSWWQLNVVLTKNPTTGVRASEIEPDLTSLPGWDSLDEQDRKRIVRSACLYLEKWRPDYEDIWLSDGKIRLLRPTFAGYRALALLASEEPSALESVKADIWARWTPIVVGYPQSSESVRERHNDLVTRVYDQAPTECLVALGEALDRYNQRNDPVLLLDSFEGSWDSRIEDFLCQRLESASFQSTTFGDILSRLLAKGSQQAARIATSHVKAALNSTHDGTDLAVTAAACLLASSRASEFWPLLSDLLENDPAIGERVIEQYLLSSDPRRVPAALSEAALSDLYLWLMDRFPHGQEGLVDDEEYVNSRRYDYDVLGHSILARLKGLGTVDSMQAVQKVADSRPDLPWLKVHAAQARRRVIEVQWRPPTPNQLFEVLLRADRRLVRSGGDLMAVVKESLGRYEQRLHGETPVVTRLWNQLPGDKWRPKTENDLSNDLKDHLQHDLIERGVLVSREVEIRHGNAVGVGQETDIHVDLVHADESASSLHLKLVLEVKGCWNQGLKTDMKNQLCDRYLYESDCNHGLYLVGWFRCSRWDDEDARKGKTPRWRLGQSKQFFEKQARGLSSASGKTLGALVLDTRLRET